MPVKLISDGEMIMGKPRTALNLNKGSEFKGAIEGLKLGESIRQARVRQALDERQMDFRETEAQDNRKRQAAIDLENQQSNAVDRQYKTAVTGKLTADMQKEQELAQRRKALQTGMPKLLHSIYFLGDDEEIQKNIKDVNARLPDPKFHITGYQKDPETGKVVFMRGVTNPDGTPVTTEYNEEDALTKVGGIYPETADMVKYRLENKRKTADTLSKEKIKLQSEESKRQKEALKNASGIADLPSAGYDVSAFEYTDDKGNKQKDYRGMKYFDEVYRKNLATMGDSKKALEATAQALRVPTFQSQLDAVKKDKTLSPEAKITARQEILAKMGQNQSPMVPMNTQAQATTPQSTAIPIGLDSIWGNLNPQEQDGVAKAIQRGANPQDILKVFNKSKQVVASQNVKQYPVVTPFKAQPVQALDIRQDPRNRPNAKNITPNTLKLPKDFDRYIPKNIRNEIFSRPPNPQMDNGETYWQRTLAQAVLNGDENMAQTAIAKLKQTPESNRRATTGAILGVANQYVSAIMNPNPYPEAE